MTNQHRSENGPASSARSTGSKTTSRALMITDAARMIFSAYRRDDFADPECFVLQLGIVLERYGDDVIRELSHPLTGIQRRLKKPPSIADIVEACEDILDRRPRPSVTMIEPPVDPVMAERVSGLLTGLAAKLVVDAQVARSHKIKTSAALHEERRQAAIRAEWKRRGQEPQPYTAQLADIVRAPFGGQSL